MAPVPATFVGTPNDLAATMVRRMKIVSPSGTNFIFVGDSEPTSNVGPWLKNGTQWFVFDTGINRYVPLDISESETRWYHIGSSTPTTSDPPLWLRTTLTPTTDDPTAAGSAIGWYEFNGTGWVPFNSVVASGATATRPAAPVDYQQYFDTTLNVLIWWERNLWRTVSGVPGDIKQVAFQTLSDALTFNPGWDLFGASNQNIRGRFLAQATRDPGGSPETELSVSAGIAERAAFETFGETDGVKIDSSSDVPYPPTIALWTLVKA